MKVEGDLAAPCFAGDEKVVQYLADG